MIRVGLVETWLCLGVLAVLLTAFAWGGWPPRVRRDRRLPEMQARGWRSVFAKAKPAEVDPVQELIDAEFSAVDPEAWT